jgi:hypothetical protein
MCSPASVGQAEDMVLVIGEAGVDRIPLDPRLELFGAVRIGLRLEHMAARVQPPEIGQRAIRHPPVQQRRAQFIEFERQDRTVGHGTGD